MFLVLAFTPPFRAGAQAPNPWLRFYTRQLTQLIQQVHDLRPQMEELVSEETQLKEQTTPPSNVEEAGWRQDTDRRRTQVGRLLTTLRARVDSLEERREQVVRVLEWARTENHTAMIAETRGKVERLLPKGTESVKSGASIAVGEAVRTGGDGRVLLILATGEEVVVDRNSQLAILALIEDSVMYRLDRGRIYRDPGAGGVNATRSSILVLGSCIRPAHEAVLGLTIKSASQASLDVLSGAAVVTDTARREALELNGGHRLSIVDGQPATPEPTALANIDRWWDR